MGGLAGFGGKIGKAVKKIDPLRGGDVILEKAGLPTFTGEGEKNIMNALSGATAGGSTVISDTTAPKAPTIDDAVLEEERARTASRRKGRSATILSTDLNQPGAGVSKKTLLGE